MIKKAFCSLVKWGAFRNDSKYDHEIYNKKMQSNATEMVLMVAELSSVLSFALTGSSNWIVIVVNFGLFVAMVTSAASV